MGILNYVTSTRQHTGLRGVISGVEKVGKTTLACSAPRVLLVPLEQGFQGMDVQRTPMLETFADVLTLCDETVSFVNQGTFPYRSIVFDSATALERLIHTAVLNTDPAYTKGNQKAVTMESALGGYGKAYQYANELFAGFLQRCDWLALHGQINIFLTCHVFAAKVLDPTVGEYETYDLLLHSPKNQKSYGKREMLTQWADLVGFLHEPLFITEGKNMNKGVSTGQGRIAQLSRTPGAVAGNRYGVTGEIPIPRDKGWNNIAHAIFTSAGADYYNRD